MILPLAGFAQKKTGRLEMLDPYAFQTKLIHMLGTLVDLLEKLALLKLSD